MPLNPGYCHEYFIESLRIAKKERNSNEKFILQPQVNYKFSIRTKKYDKKNRIERIPQFHSIR